MTSRLEIFADSPIVESKRSSSHSALFDDFPRRIAIGIVLTMLIGTVSSAGIDITALRNSTADTICGKLAAGGWLRQYVVPMVATIDDALIPLAPVGITSYGVMEVGGRYFAYELTTNAVKGVVDIPSNISVSSYWPNGEYYGRAFSVQLNSFVVARLKDGAAQYYFAQNFVVFNERSFEGLKMVSDVWNMTAEIPILGLPDMRLNSAAVRGNGAVYFCSLCRGNLSLYHYDTPNTIPFGRIELETWVHADDGKIIIEFYANGRKYDTVYITPYAPATSAHIVIAPTTTPTGHPLDLELIFGGYNIAIPYTVLERGWIGLELYVRTNDSWIPPPSAWSVGYTTVEAAYARVVPRDIGSAIVEPGPPNPRQLWAGTAVVTPFGIDITTSANLSHYAESRPKCVDFGNNARLVLTGAYVNGRSAQSLSNVPLGSLVELQYACRPYCDITTVANDKGITPVIGMALAFAVAARNLKRPRTDSP